MKRLISPPINQEDPKHTIPSTIIYKARYNNYFLLDSHYERVQIEDSISYPV